MDKPLKEEIKTFVQEVLGCACPDHIFEHIALERDIKAGDKVMLNARINIGNRLLIYVLHAGQCFTKQALVDILNRGIEDREGNGFNRFRLVLTTENIHLSQQDANVIFDTFPGKDDKMHLHFIDSQALLH